MWFAEVLIVLGTSQGLSDLNWWFFFFNDTATTEIYTLSLHDALPIWPDGGWNCDRRPRATHSSFHESWGPLLGLAAYGATEAAARAADFLLRHRVVFSDRTGEIADRRFLALRYPAYWHYDLLVGLWALAESVGLDDVRVREALALLESKRAGDGIWHVEGRWWKPPGSKGSNVDAVDWASAADRLLTERVWSVLAARRVRQDDGGRRHVPPIVASS